MPNITAFSKAFRDWEGLIGVCNENASLIPGHELLKAELEASLGQAKEAKVQQESLAGNRLAATDRFRDKLDEGSEKARKLRSYIVSVLGPRSPYLNLFGINPKPTPNPNNRRRRRVKQSSPTQPPAAPPAPEGQTTGSPAPAKPAK